MKITRVTALAVIAASVGLGVVEAQTLNNNSGPAEYPPASYTERQYVDSKGCVFIRAGIDGNVTWVPRVARSRKVVCGFPPSLPGARQPAQVAAAPAPKPEPKATPKVVRAAPPPVSATPAPKPVVRSARVPSAVRSARAPAPAPVVVPRRAAAPVLAAPAPAPKPVVVATPAPQPRRSVQGAGCAGRSALSNRYMGGSSGYAVRCGPQADAHVTYSVNPDAPRRVTPAPVYAQPPSYSAPSYQPPVASTAPAARVTSTTRVAPKHVYEQQRAAYRGLNGMPEGYKRVWMDGRLNPHRAHQNFAGKAQMDLMWTKTVPRRLIIRDTGRVVTQEYPGLMYPYTSYAQQKRANVSPDYAMKHSAGYATAAAPAAPKVTVSTRSSAAPSHRYVQAGAFTTRAQAQRAAGRIAAAGLPVRLGSMQRNGQTYSLLLAGPFNSQAQLNSALSRVRGAGFANAVLRN